VFAASMSAVVPLPLGGGEALAPCDIYKTDVYGGGCITLYYFWVLVFAVVMVALMGPSEEGQGAFERDERLGPALIRFGLGTGFGRGLYIWG